MSMTCSPMPMNRLGARSPTQAEEPSHSSSSRWCGLPAQRGSLPKLWLGNICPDVRAIVFLESKCSFQIATDDQEETDRYWNAMSATAGWKARAAGARISGACLADHAALATEARRPPAPKQSAFRGDDEDGKNRHRNDRAARRDDGGKRGSQSCLRSHQPCHPCVPLSAGNIRSTIKNIFARDRRNGTNSSVQYYELTG